MTRARLDEGHQAIVVGTRHRPLSLDQGDCKRKANPNSSRCAWISGRTWYRYRRLCFKLLSQEMKKFSLEGLTGRRRILISRRD
jgi:hypothetical protein